VIHKESSYKSDYYETIYKYINKTLKQKGYSLSSKDATNWGGLDKFQVGRPNNKWRLSYFRRLILIWAIIHLVFGLLLYIGIRLFSSKPKAYKFAQVVVRWPKMLREIIRFLRTTKK